MRANKTKRSTAGDRDGLLIFKRDEGGSMCPALARPRGSVPGPGPPPGRKHVLEVFFVCINREAIEKN